MKPFLQSIRFCLILAILPVFNFCQSSSNEKDNKASNSSAESFDPEMRIPFESDANRSRVIMVAQGDSLLKRISKKTLMPAVKNGDVKSYQSRDLEKPLSPDSLQKFSDQPANILMVDIDWQVMNSGMYARPKVKSVGLTLMKKEGKSLQKQFVGIDANDLTEVLSDEESKTLNRKFYEKGIKAKFESNNEDQDIPEFSLTDKMATVRHLSWEIQAHPGEAYINNRLKQIHETLNEKVQDGSLSAYSSPELQASLSQEALKKRCMGDSTKTQFRPNPVERPRHVIDTVITEQCNQKNVDEYLVMEKWNAVSDEPMGYRPQVKALAPLIFTRTGNTDLRIYYWLNWEEAKKHLSSDQKQWVKKYLLFHQKGDITGA